MAAFLTGTSAAQNAPVIRICPKCGALLMDDAEPCSFCDDSASDEKDELLQPVNAGDSASSADGEAEPEWRREVGRRLAEYRARRGYPVQQETTAAEAQVGLPFHQAPRARRDLQPAEKKEAVRPRTLARLRPVERMEIAVQPELDFSREAGERAHPQTALVPVATLAERRNAAAVDMLFILFTLGAFAGLFVGLMRSLGGEFMLDRIDLVMCAPVLFLFYSLYFVVFTIFAGATPGMQASGLTIVRLDGRLPDTKQLTWRGFGYVLSAATLMLGFFWAYWDEDGFTWQDRISQTYVTSSMPLSEPDAVEISGARRTPLRK